MRRLFFMLCVAMAVIALGGEYTIDLPEGDVRNRVLAIELTGESLRNLGGNADWLRLHDSKGEVIPWAFEQASTKRFSKVRTLTPLSIRQVRKPDDGTLEITFDVAPDAPLPDSACLVFKTALRNFEQQVQLWGRAGDGSEKALITDGFIFDSTDNIDARNLELDFQPGECRQFRLLLSAASLERRKALRSLSVTRKDDGRESTRTEMIFEDQSFNAKSLELWSEQVQEDGRMPVWQELSVPFEMQAGANGVSRFVVTPGVAPVSGLRLVFEEENFARRATVENLLPQATRKVGGGVLRRLTIGGLREETVIPLSDVTEGTLMVTLEDNDNPPLHLKEVYVRLPLYRLKFVASPEQFPIRLSAEPGSAKPVYDVESILALGGDTLNLLVLRPGQFSGEPVVPKVKSGGVPRVVLYLTIGLAVAAMAFALAVTLKKSEAEH